MDVRAQRRIDCDASVQGGCNDASYLSLLRSMLPPFLDAIGGQGNIGLAIYNAGTDIVSEDPLGGMTVSAKGVLERDRFVLEQLIGRKLPTLVLLSGGYSRQSYQLVAAMAAYVLETWGDSNTEGAT